jgi:hypothetical protein
MNDIVLNLISIDRGTYTVRTYDFGAFVQYDFIFSYFILTLMSSTEKRVGVIHGSGDVIGSIGRIVGQWLNTLVSRL